MKEISHFPQRNAKVILCRCAHNEGALFGMRTEEKNKILVRTWAFKISEKKAKNEGWESEQFTSSLNPDTGYNGCPYFGSFGIAQCSCGKLFDFPPTKSNADEVTLKCPWCNTSNTYITTEAFDIQGGSY